MIKVYYLYSYDVFLTFIRNTQFWILGLAYSVSTGIYSAWITQLDTLFQHADGVDQVCGTT